MRHNVRSVFLVGTGLLLAACAGGEYADPDAGADLLPSCAGLCPRGTVCTVTGECRCDPETCLGCCSDDDRCLPGVETNACGQGGAFCVDCSRVDSTCSKGTCAGCIPQCQDKECGSDGCGLTCGKCDADEECNPLGQCHCVPQCKGKCAGADDSCGGSCSDNDCQGCCEGVVCRDGNDDNYCGQSGSACAGCTATGNECGSGSCIGGQCVGQAKPDGLRCQGGQCRAGSCCTGCWDGSACQTGTAVGACGKSGDECNPCSSTEDCTLPICSAGTCSGAHALAGESCSTGVCDAIGQCCAGCFSGSKCELGDGDNACGTKGDTCIDCAAANECQTGVCDKSSGKCLTESVPDGSLCTDGHCLAGQCCTGCVDGNTCYPGTDIYQCGVNGDSCTKCAADQSCSQAKCVGGVTPTGCEARGVPGCPGCACESCVCAGDSFCCTYSWDLTCALECQYCNTSNGCVGTQSCGGGCGEDFDSNRCQCEECVCADDPYCCVLEWDAICAQSCAGCGGTCAP
jgi:hypothetical protein